MATEKEIEILKQEMETSERRFNEATEILRITRARFKEAETEWQSRNIAYSEARAKYIIAAASEAGQ